MEAEVFVRAGAWKSIIELEESLIMEELFLLYKALQAENVFNLKIAAQAAGAENIDWEEDWYDPAPPVPKSAVSKVDIARLPIGLGYEMS